MGFSTVFGHLMEGEERFSVEFRDQDSTVWLDLYSVSRGHGILGKVRLCATCSSAVGQGRFMILVTTNSIIGLNLIVGWYDLVFVGKVLPLAH